MRSLGVPYPLGFESDAVKILVKQAEDITADLKKNGATVNPNKEIIALIAYLQRLGTDIKTDNTVVK